MTGRTRLCMACYQRARRLLQSPAEIRRANLWAKYRITPEQYDALTTVGYFNEPTQESPAEIRRANVWAKYRIGDRAPRPAGWRVVLPKYYSGSIKV